MERVTGSSIVRLNRAIAIAETDGGAAALASLDHLDQTLATNHRFHATRAEPTRRLGELDIVRVAYERAIERCGNDTERAFLVERLTRISAAADVSAHDDNEGR